MLEGQRLQRTIPKESPSGLNWSRLFGFTSTSLLFALFRMNRLA